MRKQKSGKTLRRKIIIAILIAVIIVIAIVGGILLYQQFNSTEVKVYAVSDLNVGDWGDSSSISGTISNSASQEITLDADKEIEKVYVKDGDTVKKGAKLFKYDNTLNELELESNKLNKQSLELKIKTLNDQISHPKKYLEEEYEAGDDGSGSDTDDTSAVDDDADEEDTSRYDSIQGAGDPSGDNSEEDSDTDDPDGEDGTEMPEIKITQTDIKEYVSEKQSELRETKLELSKSELEISKLEKELKNMTVKSKIAGVVQMDTESSGVYMTVRAEDGLYIEGSLNEYLLNTVKTGDVLEGEDYYTGETFTAEIEKISEFPAESGTDMYDEGSYGENVSYYSFTAVILDDVEAAAGDEVNLTLQSTGSEDSIFLEKAFVLSENGNNYIYISDDKKLKKKKVKVGKTVEGSIVEIQGGITLDDHIAFPYGKEIKEGTKTRNADIDELYE